MVAKENRTLGFVRRSIKTGSRKTKDLAYKALVRPLLEYAATVWSPNQKVFIDSIERVQRRAARYVCNIYDPYASVRNMLTELKWESLEQRRLKAIITMGYKITHQLVAVSATQLVPASKITRGHPSQYRQISTRTNYYKYSFFPTFITLWNALPEPTTLTPDLERFKASLAILQISQSRN